MQWLGLRPNLWAGFCRPGGSMSVSLRVVLLACSLVVAMACSKPPPAQPAAPAVNTQLIKEFEMYQQLLASGTWELAAPIGQGIVQRFPESTQAAEVRKTLADVEVKGAAAGEHKRMARLWLYQTGASESGGMQNTAAIYSAGGGEADRVRLILRRHSEWGLSVYLFGSGKGFNCKSVCSLPATFDGDKRMIAAYLPETGEPALFIKDEKTFIAKMQKTKRLVIEANTRDQGKRTLTYDVGGYDPEKFPELAAGKSRKR